jgi:hypothetical protein
MTRIARHLQILEFLGAAAFSKAVQCVDLTDGSYVCIKIIKNNKVPPNLLSSTLNLILTHSPVNHPLTDSPPSPTRNNWLPL